ncbi:hypothetical protein R1sor_015688 [Riccia sorocarpa]|uniref:Uncharacterized protein n=1 Tax=Riccia sorocarpa TaxID=122646 RepID=A0ABD3HGV6_9MARC
MTTSRKEPGGAFVNIISTYTMTFGGKPTPRVPLYRLVRYLRVKNFQNTSVMTKALKRSFETYCYMENGAGFHICPFDETGNYVDVTEADKEKWDDLWRMESEAFDAECWVVPEYAPLVGHKFYTCMSSHETVQYDWIQDAERCLQVLSSPLIDYKEMIGDDVFEEFKKARLKSTAKSAWYHGNMTAMAAAYILSFAEVTVAKESFHLIEESEEKKLGKSLTAKQKKDMWDMKVKEGCGSWYNAVFKYATIVNPNLKPEFLSTVRELHNSLSRQPKAEREAVYNVGVDRVKAFAGASIHKDLKLELLKAHYSNAATKARYHHPVNNDVEIDIRPWLTQWSIWSNLELISQDLAEKCLKIVLSAKFTMEDLTDRLDEQLTNFIAYFTHVRDTYWEKIWS